MSPLSHTAVSELAHTGHVLATTGVVLVVLLVVAVVEKLGTRRPSAAQALTAGCCALAGGLHLAVTADHWRVDPLYGGFFLLAACAQLAAAGLVLHRPGPAVLAATVVGNAGLVALWLQTRLIAVPLGVEGGQREAFGGLDIACAAAEVVALAAAARLLSGALVMGHRRPTS